MRQPFFAVLMIGSMMVGATARAQSAGGKEATTSSATVSAEEREKAKKRLYPGGRDEEPLQVQAQLANPTRGQMAEPAEPSTDHD
ncbi:MAG: hypothetical protein KF681_17285 [Bdellovibrionaceae bacterium]|nr:hypothetical protein [Pseudobdellovibrionaceae bacterium]